MNPNDLTELDARARAAAADLRHHADARPVPSFDASTDVDLVPSPSKRPQHRMLAVAAAIVAVISLAGAAAVLATRDGREDDSPAEPVETSQLRGWQLGTVPEGFEIIGAGEDQRSTNADTGSALALYGPSLTEPQVGVAGMENWSIDQVSASDEAESFEVDGIQAVDISGYGIAPTAVVIDDPDAPGDGIIAMSASGERDQLVALAAATTVSDGTARIDGTQVPSGWTLLGDDPVGIYGGSMTATMRGGLLDARSTVYAEGTPEEVDSFRTLTATSRLGGEAQVSVARLTADEVEELEIDGQPAVLTATEVPGDIGTSRSVTWQPRAGEVLTIHGWGVSRDELLAAARSATPLPEAEWEDLVRRSDIGMLGGGDGSPVVATGSLPDGTPFALRASQVNGLDLQVAADDEGEGSEGSSSSSFDTGGNDLRLRAGISLEVGSRTFQAALVDPTVASVRVLSDGEELLAVDTTAVDLDDADAAAAGDKVATARWLVFEVPSGADEIVLLDADGNELERAGLSDSGIGLVTTATTIPGD